MFWGGRISQYLRPVLLIAALGWGVGLASAQQKPKPPAPTFKPGEKITITDAAGRKHVYHAPITDRHRKIVAVRMKQAIAAARKGKGR